MSRQILILASGISEANSYAKLAGLPRFTYRAVRSAGSISGVRNAEVHILPSFIARVDRHAILAKLQHARTLEVFYVDPDDLIEDTRGELTDDDLEDAYIRNDFDNDWNAQVLKTLVEAHRLNDLFDQEKVVPTVLIHVVPDDTEPPPSHTDLVGQVLPAHAFPIRVVAGIDQPESDFDFLADPEVQVDESEPVAPIQKRRTKCKDCEQLHFKGQPCPVVETKAAPAPIDFF